MRYRCCPIAALMVVYIVAGCGQPAVEPVPQEVLDAQVSLSPQILATDCRTHVSFLASDACDGRLTGTPGAARAASYIAGAFNTAGLRPLSKKHGFYLPFEFTAGVERVAGKNQLAWSPNGSGTPVTAMLDEDFRPLSFSGNGHAEGELVFVGYGIVEPKSKGGGYDSYAGLDVRGKIVLALRHLPGDVTPKRRQELSLYATGRYKAKLAADRGAKGFLLVTGPNSPNPGKLLRLRPTDRVSAGPIPAASISGELAEKLLRMGSLDDLETLQSAHDGEPFDPHVLRAAKEGTIRLATELRRVRKTCRNVVAVLPPTGGASGYVMVGAHYDHIGHGIGLGSLARQGEESRIHNGADDNASGTAAVLELAATAADARTQGKVTGPQRGIIFACWSGEEIGIIGSSCFAADPPVQLEEIVAYFNFDMVGRLRDNKLVVQAVGSSGAWPALIDRYKEAADFDLTTQDDPYLPTDATAFYTKGVPGLSFFTGSHEDYNRPTDDPDTLNYDGLQRIAAFADDLLEASVNPDLAIAYARVKRAAPARASGGARAYTGTVPDYTGSDVDGVRLSDVRPGGPAGEAGLESGDVIVEFAGQKIRNLQDYSDALIGTKIGQPVDIVLIRDGDRLSLKITPTARPE